jgi:hypothetical protein
MVNMLRQLAKQQDAADLLNVGKRSVERARTVLEHGTPELVAAVEHGDVAVSTAAEVATQPIDEQQEIVARGDKEILAAANRIKKERMEARKIARETPPPNMPAIGERYRLLLGDFREADIAPESIDAIICDPPYLEEFIPLYGDLARKAAEWLSRAVH